MTINTMIPVIAGQGQVDLAPRIVRVDCDNTLTEVKTASFLNDSTLYPVEGPVIASDIVAVNYTSGQGFFTPSIDDVGVVTLSPLVSTAITGATVAGHFPTFTNTTGGMSDSGAAIKGNVASNAGGSATFSITATGLTASSVAVVDFKTQANPASILTVAAGTNVINVVASADPGACTLNWIALTIAQ